jgi:hypothetical protein
MNVEAACSLRTSVELQRTALCYIPEDRKTPWPESARELYRASDRRLAKLVPIFADRGCYVVSVTDPYGRNLDSLDRIRYFFFQVARQLYHGTEWTPFQTHCTENLVAPGIES